MLKLAVASSVISTALGTVYFEDNFDTGLSKWEHSTWKGAGSMAEFEHTAGDWFVDEDADKGMATSKDMRFHAASSLLDSSFSNEGKDLVVQFSVAHKKHEYNFCGGGYIKLLPSEGLEQSSFGGDTPYYIMFGPDLCSYDVSRIHAIFNQNGNNLLKTDEVKMEYADKNKYTHLYTLVVRHDNTYEIFFDQKSKASGSLHDDWAFEAREIDDPTDNKPSDWVDEKEIPDPDDVKPEGWDDIPETIPDPEAEKPDDWDDEEDGEWTAPEISNPDFKGEWKQKMIPNPAYKGEWKARQIPNDDFVEDVYKFTDIGAVGFELWTVNAGSIFDNILVTDDLDLAIARGKAIVDNAEAEKDAEEAYKKAQEALKEAEEAEEDDDDEDDDDEKDEI